MRVMQAFLLLIVMLLIVFLSGVLLGAQQWLLLSWANRLDLSDWLSFGVIALLAGLYFFWWLDERPVTFRF